MNYNDPQFWLLFLAVLGVYWRLTHRWQNVLLLIASYIFYGAWDYRFLTLLLVATVIDYVGGLGVAGTELSMGRLAALVGLIIGSVAILCTNIDYVRLSTGLFQRDAASVLAALPHKSRDFYTLFGTVGGGVAYAVLVRRLYRRPEGARRKLFVAISMIANLSILGFFKYCDFFIDSFRHLFHLMGLGSWGGEALGIILPVGISFYTFQAMSYTIDIYRGETKPTHSFADFALFVCFFPHLVAGPIMRAHTLLPQIVRPRATNLATLEEGLFLILFGLYKKIVIADNMAPLVNSIFFSYSSGTSAPTDGANVLLSVYAFAFQIYADFSGYSSVARGISKWLGFELVINFWTPYLAVSPSDFWRRWHISLSTWLRDYLYIPLGGNRRGSVMTYRNLMITMLLGGLWHGASWTYVLWGLYHGVLLCFFRLLGIRDPSPRGGPLQRAYWLIRVIIMFHLTCLGWLIFRADSFVNFDRMAHDLTSHFVWTHYATSTLALIIFYCLPLFAIEFALDGENKMDHLARQSSGVRSLAYVFLVVMLLFFRADRTYEFIYFQF